MATFSQQFLANLGRPQMAESLFGLGQAIGGVPGQMKQRQQQQNVNQLIQEGQAAMASGDVAKLAEIGQKLTAAGNPQQGQAFIQASMSLKEKQQQLQQTTGQQRASAQMLMSELQDYANDTRLSEPVRVEASNLLKAAAQAGDRATLLEPRVAQLRTRVSEMFKPAKPISMAPGGVLLDPVTNKPVYQAPFKPATPPAPRAPKIDIIRPTKEDPNIRIFEDGQLTQTISTKTEGKTREEVEADNNRISQIVRIKADVKELMDPEGKYSGWTASGVTGQILGNWIGGTTAYDRNAVINSLKSSLGLDMIKDLKQSSKTGATGLGPVSNVELNALQSEIATLSIGMSADAQLDSLQKIFDHLDRVQQLASGIVPIDAIDWNSEEYVAAGYGRDLVTGVVMYTPEGPSGPVYKFIDGSFKKLDI